jgi:hypothetical protein
LAHLHPNLEERDQGVCFLNFGEKEAHGGRGENYLGGEKEARMGVGGNYIGLPWWTLIVLIFFLKKKLL